MNAYLLLAAALGLLIACIHVFVGSRTDVAPLLRSDLPEPAKSTFLYCWHLVTIVLFAMAGLFLWGALQPSAAAPVYIALFLSAAFCLWGFVIAALRRRSPFAELPQGLLFLVLTGAGAWGAFVGGAFTGGAFTG